MSRTFVCGGCQQERVAPGKRGKLPSWCEECAPTGSTRSRLLRSESLNVELRAQRDEARAEVARLGHVAASQARRLALASDLLGQWAAWSTDHPPDDDALADALLAALRAGYSTHARRALLAVAGGCLARALALSEERAERMTAA